MRKLFILLALFGACTLVTPGCGGKKDDAKSGTEKGKDAADKAKDDMKNKTESKPSGK